MPLPPSSKYVQRPNDPVDEAERDSMTARLNAAFSDGRLSHEEYVDAMELLYSATTLGALAPVAERLPAPAAEVPAIVAQAGPVAGSVNEPRNLSAVAVAGALLGAGLLIALLVLLVMLF